MGFKKYLLIQQFTFKISRHFSKLLIQQFTLNTYTQTYFSKLLLQKFIKYSAKLKQSQREKKMSKTINLGVQKAINQLGSYKNLVDFINSKRSPKKGKIQASMIVRWRRNTINIPSDCLLIMLTSFKIRASDFLKNEDEEIINAK